jgi:hypothetical protein
MIRRKSSNFLEQSAMPFFRSDADINSSALNVCRYNVSSQSSSIVADYDVYEVARHITLVDFDLYSRIRATEYVDSIFRLSEHGTGSKNLFAFASRFNEVGVSMSSSNAAVSSRARPDHVLGSHGDCEHSGFVKASCGRQAVHQARHAVAVVQQL